MLQRISLTAVLLAGAFTVAQADVYRWVDDQGQPHYSDQWVPGSVVVKTDKARPASTAGGAGEQKALAASNARISEQLKDEANARAVQADKAKSRDVQCKAAKDAYDRAISSRRVYKEDKDGGRSYLSDQDADNYRESLRKSVESACGSVPQFDPNAPIPEPQPIEPKPIPEPKVNPAEATSE